MMRPSECMLLDVCVCKGAIEFEKKDNKIITATHEDETNGQMMRGIRTVFMC